jgi:hypothetical protein
MNEKKKIHVSIILICILTLILFASIIGYILYASRPEISPAVPLSNVTRPLQETQWTNYDSEGRETPTTKDARLSSESKSLYAWEKYAFNYPKDWHFQETRVASPRTVGALSTSFTDTSGAIKLIVTAGSDPVSLSSQLPVERAFKSNTFSNYSFQDGRMLYIYKTGSDDEITDGAAAQLVFEFHGVDDNTIKTLLESFVLKTTDTIPTMDNPITSPKPSATFDMKNSDQDINACTQESTPLEENKQALIKEFYARLADKDFKSAASMLSGDEPFEEYMFSFLFPVCSSAHIALASAPTAHGLAVFTSNTNGGMSIPNDTYSFGLITASDNNIYLYEHLIINFIDKASADEYQKGLEADTQSAAFNRSLEIVGNLETKTVKEFKTGIFTDKNEQKEYDDFLAQFDAL